MRELKTEYLALLDWCNRSVFQMKPWLRFKKIFMLACRYHQLLRGCYPMAMCLEYHASYINRVIRIIMRRKRTLSTEMELALRLRKPWKSSVRRKSGPVIVSNCFLYFLMMSIGSHIKSRRRKEMLGRCRIGLIQS